MSSVEPQTPYNEYDGDGVSTVYPFEFQLLASGDMVVTIDGVLVPTSEYLLSGVGEQDGGDVIFNTPPLAGTAVLLSRVIQLRRDIDYQYNGELPERIVDLDFNRLWQAIQGFGAILGGSVRAPFPEQLPALPPAVDRANKLLGFNAAGDPIVTTPNPSDATAVALALAQYIASVASTASASVGAGLVGFNWALYYAPNTGGWGTRTASTSYNFWRSIPVAEWAAISAGTSTYDVTALLTAAIANERDVYVPRGVYSVNPDIGVRLVGSTRLHGAGQNQTIFAAVAQGGTLAELTSYTKGSVFKRAYSPGVANARVDTVHLSDFAVVLNHPTGVVTTTEIQIGLDLRHIGRTVVERVWSGNIAPLGGLMVKADPGAYAAQGYGIVIGNVDTGNAGYCGGEVHRIRDCSVFGAYKLIVQDDATLSPLSGAHNVNVIDCDIQGGHHLLVQEQQYASGNLWSGNAIQDIRRKPGDASATYAMRVAGYDNDIGPGYIEAGTADYLLRFDSASDNNRARLTHYSATTIGIAAFSDTGRRNRVECRMTTGIYPSGVDSKGMPIVRYDRSFEEMSIICHYDGVSAMVKDGGYNLTVTRPTGAGDYLFTYGLPVVDANSITIEVSHDTNVSGHGGLHAVISKGTTNIRIQFYAQNGATTTAIDPRFVFVKVKQVVTQ